jgi:hypothetical protein
METILKGLLSDNNVLEAVRPKESEISSDAYHDYIS